jgi:NitT/TauT family transport system substrate-binding protein
MKTIQTHGFRNFRIRSIFKCATCLSAILCFLMQEGICLSGEGTRVKDQNLKVLFIPYQGFFTEQGLKIEFVRLGRSAEAIPALTQGNLDVIAGTTSFSLFNAIARGAKIKIVADKGYIAPAGCTELAIMARKGWAEASKPVGALQLKGRRIAVNPVSSAAFIAEKALQPFGLTLDDLQIVDLPDPVKLEAFAANQIDLAYANEPWVTRMSQAGHAVPWISASQVVPDFQNGFITYGPSLLGQYPDVGRRFMVAYRKGVLRYNEGKTDRNLDIIAKHSGLDRELLRQACWPTFRANGAINARSMLEFQGWGSKKGFLDMTATEEQFWDSSFLDYANRC